MHKEDPNPTSKTTPRVNGKRVLVIMIVSIALFWFLVPGNGIYLFYEPQWMKNKKCCSIIERVAYNIAASLADYFSEPTHTRLPNIEELEKWRSSKLTDHKEVFLATIAGTTDHILITVIPNPDICRCHLGEEYIYHITSKGSGEWTGTPSATDKSG